MTVKTYFEAEGFDLGEENTETLKVYIEEFGDIPTQLTIETIETNNNASIFTFAFIDDVIKVRDILNEYIKIAEEEL